ncbi:SDR family oxidoreductase [Chelatococcus asaccharovorans]|uniref:NADP-dependent 3-hydroxy acid dehydrogenase YdfG n=1 Tax=Chelatococcus asaccharovorans TaxID=28210 RepID=A0A2V3U462_9HYPH|nr:SDR family oxidoreductase [Chelatococcus asaccharovorans]MBS7702786.1 SDR family oxidoreductase [Chelatococcus asaccharovorans]PXW57078.1 NADP-dependent 3-hydroxy acid dehydrogenase YdfG [Chelatococcus asaccharovorans]
MAFSDYRMALVTGASSGIGATAVRRLCAEGLTVHAVARNAARLAELAAETGCEPHALDVCDSFAVERLVKSIDVDILVNNAGQSRRGTILETTPGDVNTLVDINLRAVLHLTRLIVPGMGERNRGHVVNISSIAGLYAFGENETTFNSSIAYHATKAGIHLLSQQLRVDLLGKSVRVTEIAPGRVATNVFAHAKVAPDDSARLTTSFETLQPSDIADLLIFAIKAPERMNVATLEVTPTCQVVGGLQFARRAV